MISLIPRAAGIYVLVLLVEAPLKIHVGSLGYITITRGKYVYLGSARGPGGLLARINRH
ncbi:MAG: GIY-YIG nuclease family protein, partial [Thermoprotei archaeon]